MIGFVIPFKSKAKSKNWAVDCALLHRTLLSVVGQTDKRCKAYVVYSDLPAAPLQHPNVEWVKFPFPFYNKEQIADAERYNAFGKDKKSWEHLPFFFDQGKKSLYGAAAAKADGCRYIMMLDADDLISNKVAAFVNSQDAEKNLGFYMNTGYLYAENSHVLLKVPDQMHCMCGSTNIVRSDIVPSPDFSSPYYKEFDFFAAHSYMPERMVHEHKQSIRSLPFYGLIYVFHNSNEMASKAQLKQFSFRNLARHLIRGKLVTPWVRREFSIQKLRP